MKDEALFKEKVEELAVLKIERGEHGRRLGKTAKLAKALIGMKGGEFRKLTNVIYSTTPAAKEAADKRGVKKYVTKLERMADDFAQLYTQLALLGQGERLEKLLANKGVVLSLNESFDPEAKFEARGKIGDNVAELWEEVLAGEEIPRTSKERAKLLIDSGLVCLNDMEELRQKMSGPVLDEIAEDCGVAKRHLVRTVGLKVKEIRKGDDVIPDAVEQIATDAEQLCEALNAMIPEG